MDHKHSLLPISEGADARLACSVGLVDHGLDDSPPRIDEPERQEEEEETACERGCAGFLCFDCISAEICRGIDSWFANESICQLKLFYHFSNPNEPKSSDIISNGLKLAPNQPIC